MAISFLCHCEKPQRGGEAISNIMAGIASYEKHRSAMTLGIITSWNI